jgi:hypothetical protein
VARTRKVDGGNKVVFSSSSFSVAKLGDAEKTPNNLEAWSKDRSKTIAQANRGFNRRDMSLAMIGFNSGWGSTPSLSGFWLYSYGYGCYTFLPFRSGWGSPYGGSYYNSMYGNGNYCCGRSTYGGYYNPGTGGYNGPITGGTASNPNNGPSGPAPSAEPRGYSEPRTFPSMPQAPEPRSFPSVGEGRSGPMNTTSDQKPQP